MRRITGFLVSVSFFLWIQPLGAFIQPSQEEAVCGGNRAFHMCSTQFTQTRSDANPQKVFFTGGTETEKAPSSSGSSGSDLTAGEMPAFSQNQALRFFEKSDIFPTQACIFRSDPVPKF